MFKREHREHLGVDSSHYCDTQLTDIAIYWRLGTVHTLIRLFLQAAQPALDF